MKGFGRPLGDQPLGAAVPERSHRGGRLPNDRCRPCAGSRFGRLRAAAPCPKGPRGGGRSGALQPVLPGVLRPFRGVSAVPGRSRKRERTKACTQARGFEELSATRKISAPSVIFRYWRPAGGHTFDWRTLNLPWEILGTQTPHIDTQ